MNIAVHLAEGFEEIEAISIIDVLRRAGFSVRIVSVTGNQQVKGAHEIVVQADKLFEELDYNLIDMLILPGGMPGTRNLQAHQGLRDRIKEFHKNNKPLGAICAAPLVLGDLGILKGKKATCYPGFEEELKGAQVTGNAVEKDGNIITGKGAGVAIDFAIEITAMLKTRSFAEELRAKLIAQR